MVDDNLTLAESATRRRLETYQQRQQFELEQEQMRRAPAPTPQAPPEDVTVNVPAQTQETPPAPEVDPYFQTLETDPEIVRNALNENPVIREANRMIYGDAAIASAIKARDSGNAEILKETSKPLPVIQQMMAESGQSAMTVAMYMYGQNDPVFLEKLRQKLGPVAFSATANAVKTHQGAQDIENVSEKGLFGSIVSDVSGLATRGDIFDAPVAGMAMFSKSLARLGGWVPSFNNAVDGIPVVGDVAAGLGITKTFVSVNPESEQEIARLREILPNYRRNNKGLEQLEVGKTTQLFLNPEQLKSYNEAYNFTGNQANMAAMRRQEQAFLDSVDTVSGQILAGVTEFSMGWVGAPLRVATGANLAVRIGQASLKGAAVDNFIFDAEDGNLTAMLRELGVVDTNPFIELLSADMDDTAFERRLAVTLEGMVLGAGADILIEGVMRGIRKVAAKNPEAAAEEFDKAITNSLKKADEENKAVVEELNAKAEEYYKKLNPTSSSDAPAVETLEFNAIPNINKAVELPMMENLAKYAKIQGRANDVDLSVIEELTGISDLRAKVITEDAAELQKVITDRLIGVFGKIQEPKNRSMIAAMSSKIIERHGFEFMNKDLQDAFSTDVSKWSDEQSANLVAAATLEDMLQEQYLQVITEMDSFLSNGKINKSLFPGVEDIDDLRLIREKITAQRAILRAGRAKIANQAGRALRITRMLGKQDQVEEYARQKAAWRKDLGVINDREEIALIKTILDTMKDKSTREFSKTLDDIGKPRGLEKWLRVSNANLLTGIGTQALMLGSNVARVLSEGLFRGVQGVILEPATAVRYWKNKELREAALTRASQQTRQAYLWYAAVFTNLPKMWEAGFRYFDTGVSSFNQRTFVDETNPFAGKSLNEIMKEDEGLKLLGRAEYLYRWMGGVDEAFKELVVSADQQIRAATGEFGPGSEKPWYKVTQEDVNKIMAKNPDAIPGANGRLSDADSVERAKEIMFQYEPEKGSLRGMVQSQLTRKNRVAVLARMLGMRFVSTPLAVMEQRFTNVLSPIALAIDLLAGPKRASNMKFVMGKFAGDLDSPRPEVRQRARAVLLTNSLIGSMAITYYLAGYEFVNLDPRSKDYMKIRSPLEPEGSKRWFNIADAESPLNAFVMWTALFDTIVRAADPTEVVASTDVASAMITLFIDETLEKSSLGNFMDTLSSISDPDPRKIERFLIQQATPFNPFGWYQRKILGWRSNMEGDGFDGRPADFTERLGKAIPPFQLIFGGVSNRLRNPMGELINPTNGIIPFVTPSRLDDPVMKELEEIQEITGDDFVKDQFTTRGLDYSVQPWSKGQSVWDRAQQLISQGDIKLNGRTLREALEVLINSYEYQEAFRGHVDDLVGQPNIPGTTTKRARYIKDPRADMVRQVLDQYRQAGVDEALRTIPEDNLQRIVEIRDSMERAEDRVRASVYQSQQ